MLDNQYPNLRFTCEKAPRTYLLFLGAEVTICGEEFDISVHCKQTFVGVLMHLNNIAYLSLNEALSLLHCIVLIRIHQMTHY